MFRLQVAVFPQASVAVQVRVMPPVHPGVVASTNVIETLLLQLSDAVAVPKLGDAGQSSGVTTLGQVIVGGVMSRTVTDRLQVEVFPQPSVAWYVRVYTTGQVPLTTSFPICATVGVPQLSVADGVGQVGVAGQSMVSLAAQLITGGCVSEV